MTHDIPESLAELETQLGAAPPAEFERAPARLLDELATALAAARAREDAAMRDATRRALRVLPRRLRARAVRALVKS